MFQHPALRNATMALKAFQTPDPGRPVQNIRPFILKPTDRLPSGSEFLNTMPAPIKAAHEKYLKSGSLPPGLAPTRTHLRPQISEAHRAAQISKGWKNPRKRY